MTKPQQPTAAQIEKIGRLLARYWAPARQPLSLYTTGRAPWEGALRTVRTLLRDVMKDSNRGPKVPIGVRDQLTVFAGQYGTETRATASGTEGLTVRKTARFSEQEWVTLMAAAKRQGITPAEFVRHAAVVAAQREMEGP